MDGIIAELGPILASYHNPVVCFSGGLDSTALLRNALEFCDDVTALFVKLPMNSQRQIESARKVAEYLGADLTIAELGWDDLKGIERNDENRCYICKTAFYALANAIAAGSSGLGDFTVGKLPSTTICSSTQYTFSKPFIFRISGTKRRPVP